MTQASYTTFETASSAKIHRLPLEAFPKFWVYAYLVQLNGENYLIDCGSGTDGSHQNLLDGLTQVGLQPADLNYILLTHAHIDHYGGLSKLKPLTNAKIGCHELDVQTVAHHDADFALTSRRFASFLAETGLAEATRDSLLNIYRFTKGMYESVRVDFTYESNNLQVGPFDMIHLPGHCPGHIALRLDDVIFCGDMVVEGVTPHISPETITPYSGLDHYLDSLNTFQLWAKDTRLILNGHDEAITDLAAQIESTKQNILRRISKAIQALSEPLTLAATCQAVYGSMEGYNGLLVIEKTGAYVEYLYTYGMVTIMNVSEIEQGLPARYQNVRDADSLISDLEKQITVQCLLSM
jgi:glyoxylase-like metal-dependent hydrolase (beta-lactamase superfamily II)